MRRWIEMLNPSLKAQNNLGNAYKDLGKIDEAIIKYETAIKFKPDYAVAYYSLGNAYELARDHLNAIKNFGEAIKYKPDYVEAYCNWGTVLFKKNLIHDAVDKFTKAINIDEKHAPAHLGLGNCYWQLRELDLALNCYDAALKLQPNNSDAYSNIANVEAYKGNLTLAASLYQDAIRLNPSSYEAHNNLGHVLKDGGDLETAEYHYREAIQIDSLNAEAHFHLSIIKSYTDNDEHLKLLRELSHQEMDDHQACLIQYAMAKALDDIGDYKTAFQSFLSANELRRSNLNYTISKDITLFDLLYEINSKLLQMPGPVLSEKLDVIPIFIVGMPRSGTTLIEQIISSHSGVKACGELETLFTLCLPLINDTEAININNIEKLRQDYLKSVRDLSDGCKYITDKMPLNFRLIPFIQRAIPEAKIVNVTREARATCWSNFRHFFQVRDWDLHAAWMKFVSIIKCMKHLCELCTLIIH